MYGPAGLDDALGRIYLHGSRDLKKKHRRLYASHSKIVDIYIFIALHYQNLCTFGAVASLLSIRSISASALVGLELDAAGFAEDDMTVRRQGRACRSVMAVDRLFDPCGCQFIS